MNHIDPFLKLLGPTFLLLHIKLFENQVWWQDWTQTSQHLTTLYAPLTTKVRQRSLQSEILNFRIGTDQNLCT